MKQCRKVEKYLSRGRFGERLTDLPGNLRTHIETCESCRAFLNECEQVEHRLYRRSSDTAGMLSPRARARIRQGITEKTDSMQHPAGAGWFGRRYWLAGGAVAILLLLIVFNRPDPMRNTPEVSYGVPAELVATLDSSTMTDLMEDLEPDIYNKTWYESIDTTRGTDVLNILFSSESDDVIEAASDIVPSDGYAVYEDDVLTSFSELDDNDLNDLRRYLS